MLNNSPIEKTVTEEAEDVVGATEGATVVEQKLHVFIQACFTSIFDGTAGTKVLKLTPHLLAAFNAIHEEEAAASTEANGSAHAAPQPLHETGHNKISVSLVLGGREALSAAGNIAFTGAAHCFAVVSSPFVFKVAIIAAQLSVKFANTPVGSSAQRSPFTTPATIKKKKTNILIRAKG